MLNKVQNSKLLCYVQLYSNVCYILYEIFQLTNDIKVNITIKANRKVWPEMEYIAI